MRLIPFDLEKAKAGWGLAFKDMATRHTRIYDVKIVSYTNDTKYDSHDQPILVLYKIFGDDVPMRATFCSDGSFWRPGSESGLNLMIDLDRPPACDPTAPTRDIPGYTDTFVSGDDFLKAIRDCSGN